MELIKTYNIPIENSFDVVVCGGGPAGVSAAISAAKCGARTALIERHGYTGGQATGGLVILIVGRSDGKNIIIKGFCEETIEKLKDIKAAQNIGSHILFDPESMKLIFDKMLFKHGIKTLFHRLITDVIVEDSKIKAIITDGKSGKKAITGSIFIDATGDADLAKLTGTEFIQRKKEKLMPVTLGFRAGGINTDNFRAYITENWPYWLEMLKELNISTTIGGWIETTHPGEVWFNIANLKNIDITNSDDLTKAEITCRKKISEIIKKFRENIFGCENIYLIDTAHQIGGRESRIIKGLYTLEKQDCNKTFKDSIAKAPNYIKQGNRSIQIPYRCLISSKINNLIFAGRCISVKPALLDMIREIPCCMATGQAAGVISAACVKHNWDVHNIEISIIRDYLLDQNAIF